MVVCVRTIYYENSFSSTHGYGYGFKLGPYRSPTSLPLV